MTFDRSIDYSVSGRARTDVLRHVRGCVAFVALGLSSAARAEPAESAERDTLEGDETHAAAETTARPGELVLGVQYFWLSGKSMPGLTLQVGRGLFALDLEASLLWLTEPAQALDLSFVGMQLGAGVMLVPLRSRRFRAAAGLGADVYYPWRIHEDAVEAALSAKVTLHGWLTQEVALFATARAYPLSTHGLELGSERDGSSALPVLFTSGIAWRFQ